MTWYLAKKLKTECVYATCKRPPLPDHNCCLIHRDGHRARNRASTRQRRRMAAVQMVLPMLNKRDGR